MGKSEINIAGFQGMINHLSAARKQVRLYRMELQNLETLASKPVSIRQFMDVEDWAEARLSELRKRLNLIQNLPGYGSMTTMVVDDYIPSDTPEAGGDDIYVSDYMSALNAAGLWPDNPTGLWWGWLENASKRGISIDEILKIVKEQGLTPSSFDVLAGLEVIHDPDGKSFFLLPTDILPQDAMVAVLMTYIFNCGTDYGVADKPGNRYNSAGSHNDFSETPYSNEEIERIRLRQMRNSWTYDADISFVHANGGRLVTTPNGMMMGLGGNGAQGVRSLSAGTTWGDIYFVNIDHPNPDPQTVLSSIIKQGGMPAQQDATGQNPYGIDLDRVLHHEERHSQQWAREGLFLGLEYLVNAAAVAPDGAKNWFEQDAGLHDGGYR